MPNGKPGDNPLSDLIVQGEHLFPNDIEEMLLKIDIEAVIGKVRWVMKAGTVVVDKTGNSPVP